MPAAICDRRHATTVRPHPPTAERPHPLDHGEQDLQAAAAAAGDPEARDALIRANLGLVVVVARPYSGRGVDLDDLVSEGNLGLIRAAERFDPGAAPTSPPSPPV